MNSNQNPELAWIGKDQRPQLEPRILQGNSVQDDLFAGGAA